MKTLFLQIIFFFIMVASACGANRYWVADSQALWNDMANWSNTSGGSGGASVPGTTDIAIFNGDATGNCIIDINVDVKGIDIMAGYSGTISQNNQVISVRNKDFKIAGGSFLGGSGNLNIESTLQLDGGLFTSSSSTLTIKSDFIHTNGTFFHNFGTIVFNGSGNRYYDVTSPEPELHNAVINLNDNQALSIRNKDLKVLNKIELKNGKLNNGKVQIRDSVIIDNDYDNGASDLYITGSGNSQLIFSDGASMLKDVIIEKSSSTDTVFVYDHTVMGLINFGEDNMDLVIRKGVLSFDMDFTTDLDFDNLYIEPGGTLNISGGTIDFRGNFTNSGGTLNHTGGVFAFDDGENQAFSVVNSSQNKFYDIRVNKGNNKKLTINSDDTLYVKNDLELIDGQVNAGVMLVEGNVEIEADFDRGSSPLIFGGQAAQTLDLNDSPGNFDADIIVNKSEANSITLLSPFTIDGNNQDLILNRGIIVTDETNILALDDNRTISGGSSESYIEGPLLKIGNDAFEFPVGRNFVYAPVSISRPGNNSHSFRAEYFDTSPAVLYDPQSKDLTLNHISSCEYWVLDRIDGDSEVEVTLSWDDPRSCGITDLCELSVARWDGTAWRDHGNGGTTGTASAGSLVTGSNCITPEVVVDFSPFTLASRTPNNPLPVELIDFTAARMNDYVEINWSTASEINNDYFLIERSRDALNWEELAVVEGAGNAITRLDYSYMDQLPYPGDNYYRLKQVDFDGSTDYSKIAVVEMPVILQEDIFIYPNPATDYIRIRNGDPAFNGVFVFDLMGRNYEVTLSPAGNEIEVDLRQLPQGMYLVRIGKKSIPVYKK